MSVNWQRLVSLSFNWAKRDLILLPKVFLLSRSTSRIANGACRPGFPFRNCLPPYGGWFWSFFSSISRLIVFSFVVISATRVSSDFNLLLPLLGSSEFPRGSFGSLYLDSGCMQFFAFLFSGSLPYFDSSRGAIFLCSFCRYFPVLGLANLLGACHRERIPVLLWI